MLSRIECCFDVGERDTRRQLHIAEGQWRGGQALRQRIARPCVLGLGVAQCGCKICRQFGKCFEGGDPGPLGRSHGGRRGT
ncbi:MAG: hypothetical protein ABS99_01975 [Acetobacteraceae bacterium SCN 69-10]|nr:MAG: hypothetical protein ABS99_01975 [Acetobacteraceae bacterium SCN 69-10]